MKFNEELMVLQKKLGGARTQKLLDALGRGAALKQALESDVGKQILGDLYQLLENAYERLIEDKHEPDSHEEVKVRAECRCYTRLFKKWANMIDQHEKNIGEYDKNTRI